MDHLVSMAKIVDSYYRCTSGWIGYNTNRDVLCCSFPGEVNLRCHISFYSSNLTTLLLCLIYAKIMRVLKA